MKRGVCTGPWGVWKQPQRARVWGQRAVIWKLKGAGSWKAGVVAAQSAGGWGAGLNGTPNRSDPGPLGIGAATAAVSADGEESGLISRWGLAEAGSGRGVPP